MAQEPREVFFIGRMMAGEKIELYTPLHMLDFLHAPPGYTSGDQPPATFTDYAAALKQMQSLNRSFMEAHGVGIMDMNDGDVWRVYTMKVQEADQFAYTPVSGPQPMDRFA